MLVSKTMGGDKRQRNVFLLVVLAVFSAVSLLTYFPVFEGKVPFPAQKVTDFPPWESVPTTITAPANPAEYGDIVTLFYPWRHFLASALHDGELPLWNPHILSGTPFLGNTQSAFFFPLNAFFYVLPVPIAWVIKLIVTLMLAGTFTALFVRSIGGNMLGSISAGLVFALSGLMTAWQATTLTDAMMWLPLICLAVHRMCVVRSDGWAFALSAVAFALPVLAGHPETAAQLTVTGCAFAVWQSFSKGQGMRAACRRLGIFMASGFLAIGLAAIQILPTLEWIEQINHGMGAAWPTLNAYEWLSFFSRDVATNPNSSGLLVPESVIYAGMLTLLVAPLAFLSRGSRREGLFFLVVIGIAVQIIYGVGPVHWLVQHTPVIQSMKNWRMLAIVDFSLGVLAGLGISALSELVPKDRPSRMYLWMAPMMCLVVTSVGIGVLQSLKRSDVSWLHGPISTTAFLASAYVLLLFRTLDWLRPRIFGVAAAGLLAVDLITFAYGYLPFAPPREMYPDAPLVRFLKKEDPSQFRVASLDSTYIHNFEMMYGFHGAGGYDLGLRSIKGFVWDLGEPTLDSIAFSAAKVAGSNDRRLDLLNAKYFVTTTNNDSYRLMASRPDRYSLAFSHGSVRVFESRSVLPRAIFVPATEAALEVISDEEAQLERLKDPVFNPERSVILPELPPDLSDPVQSQPATPNSASVSWMKSAPNEIELKVVANAPGVLVLSQTFYPGWQVFVDGRAAPILRPDYALTGVALQGGTHSARFVFRPISFRIGRTLTLASLLVLGIVVARYRAKNDPEGYAAGGFSASS